MKTYKEMADNVLLRIDDYELKKKRRKKAVIRTIPVLVCLCIVAVISISVFRDRNKDTELPTSIEKLAENETADKERSKIERSEEDDSEKNDPEKNASEKGNLTGTDSGSWETSMKSINGIFSGSTKSSPAKENMLDSCYPDSFEKYRSVIWTALACKMNMNDASDHKFPVIIDLYENLIMAAGEQRSYKNLKNLIDNVNDKLNTKIDIQDGIKVYDPFYEKYAKDFSNKYNFSKKYCFNLTKEQILAIADVLIDNKEIYRAQLKYVGSGKGSYKDQNFDTPEGLDTYCELHGDYYIMKDSEIVCTYPYPFIDENGDIWDTII